MTNFRRCISFIWKSKRDNAHKYKKEGGGGGGGEDFWKYRWGEVSRLLIRCSNVTVTVFIGDGMMRRNHDNGASDLLTAYFQEKDTYRQLRARKALSRFNDVPLSSVDSISLVLNGTSFNSINALLALTRRYITRSTIYLHNGRYTSRYDFCSVYLHKLTNKQNVVWCWNTIKPNQQSNIKTEMLLHRSKCIV